MKRIEDVKIIDNVKISETNIYRMIFENVNDEIKPGQFVNISVPGVFLPRPISVADYRYNQLFMIYRVVGEGTELMANMKEGDCVTLLTGLGNGFDTEADTKKPLVIGGGMGAAPIYMNNRDLYKYPYEQEVVMDYLAELIRLYYPDAEAIYGTPMSAIIFGGLVAERLHLPVGFVRKEAKDHGIKTNIEGPVREGLKVVQIEDLITSGESSLEFIRPLQDAGMDVLGIAAIVDNDFVESKKLIEAGIPYHALTTGTKIAEYASKAGIILPEDVDKIKVYKNDAKDESWMSEQAKERIAQKRLERSAKTKK